MKKIVLIFVSFSLLLTTLAGALTPFDINLHRGNTHTDVERLQKYLNEQGFILAKSGPGSPGNETNYFGPRTQRALRAFQNHYKADILSPLDLLFGTGNFFSVTRNFINSLIQNKNIIPVAPIVTEPQKNTEETKESNVTTTGIAPAIYTTSQGSRTIPEATITFEDETKDYSTTPFTLAFTSNSNAPTVFTSSNPAIASISGDTVTMHNIGTVTITAVQEATESYKGSTTSAQLQINDVNLCLASPCLNGGTCSRVVPGSFTCSCPTGFIGPTCSIIGYSIGGTATGLTGTVVLQNNGSDNRSVTTNGAFSFSTFLSNATAYIVSILSAPADQICSLVNATGSTAGSNITNILLNCLVRPTITGFPDITNNAATGTPTYTLTTPTSNSAGAFTYSIANGSIGSISGNILTVNGRGITTLTATQAANGIYGAGTINATLTMLVTDACAANPCGSNGTCTRTSSGPGGFLDSYSCTCGSGYYGTNCQFVDNSSDQCLTAPCEHGGICTRTSSTPSGPLDSFTCSCEGTGFSGDLCELSDANCSAPGYCLNGGTCNATPTGGECSCYTCYGGDRCDEYSSACA